MYKVFLALLLPLSVIANDIIIEDFKSGFTNWKVEGKAFGDKPVQNGVGRQGAVDGAQLMANSFHQDDAGKGKMTSKEFTIEKSAIKFFIGGGRHPGETCMNLIIDGKVVLSATGHDSNKLALHSWDVTKFKNRKAHLEIVDNFSGGWGFVMVAKIYQTDAALEKFKTLGKFTTPRQMEMTHFADASKIKNPTTLCIDEKGRVFVAETNRFRTGGVDDNREHRYWTLDDSMCETTAERLAMYKKWAAKGKQPMNYYTDNEERIIMFQDKDGDGKADVSTVFADGFNDPLDGTSGGLIAKDNTVYFACIPHLWALPDADEDGKADKRVSLQEGFGVRVSISGHDMNGFVWGPDGKLYGSVGDRGYNLKTKDGKHFKAPMSGCVFRCNPDGTDFELVYTGLRNPKEIIFDQYGKLFTVDNDGDFGDEAMINYLIEGGEKGWHSGHQLIANFGRELGIQGNLNPWITEGQWKMRHKDQPAFILPPVAHFTNGPGGLTYDPGIGLPAEYKDNFFVTDYCGGAGNSGIWNFKLAADGAGFKMESSGKFIWGVCATDVDFSYDGNFFLSDYIGGWSRSNQGNVFAFNFPDEMKKPIVQSTKKLFAQGFKNLDSKELFKLLSHPDMRARQRAQFTLVERKDGMKYLYDAAKSGSSIPVRLNGIWGLGQLAAKGNVEAAKSLMSFLSDSVPNIREQSAKALGTACYQKAGDKLTELLSDSDPSVRAISGIAIGKLAYRKALPEVFKMIRENADKDPWVRHGGMMALQGINDVDAMLSHAKTAGNAERLAIVLTLRRLNDYRIHNFLNDSDRFIIRETIRAINDNTIDKAMPYLARHLEKYLKPGNVVKLNDLDLNRIINANFRTGTKEFGVRLLKFALTDFNSERTRKAALWSINNWDKPPVIDYVSGMFKPIKGQRDDIKAQVSEFLPLIISKSKDEVQAKAIALAKKYEINVNINNSELLLDSKVSTLVRLEILKNMKDKAPENFKEILAKLCVDENAEVSGEALMILSSISPDEALNHIEKNLSSAKTLAAIQNSYRALASLNHPKAADILTTQLKGISKLDKAVHLDLIQAAQARKEESLVSALKAYNDSLPKDKLAPYYVTLHGGNPKKGEEIVKTHGSAQCTRCHKVNGFGGIVAPDLSDIGLHKDGKYLLESIVDPQAAVAVGYALISVTLKDGNTLSGIVKSESDTELILLVGESKKSIKIADIKSRTKPVSGMPPMGFILKPHEIRDVIAYLKTLKTKPEKH